MELNYYYTIIIISVLLLLSVLTGKFASKFGVSSLLGILGIGLVLGNGGVYDFDYNYPELTLKISQIALCFILFFGGIGSSWPELKKVATQGLSMASIGVLITALCVGIGVYFLLGWSFLESLLLGAVISSTDAAAVFSILESTQLRLKNQLGYVLEFESGTNDPMAYFLTISLSSFLTIEDQSYLTIVPQFLWNAVFGVLSGLGVGAFIYYLIHKAKLKKGQSPMVLICSVLFIFGLNELVGGSAFLAVYVAGIYLGNKKWEYLDFNLNFYEGISWLMEAALFLILGLQVYITHVGNVIVPAIIISLILIFVARPIATWITYIFIKKKTWQHKTFISWVGLKGATPIVFSLIPLVDGVPVAENLFNISFIVVISSILIQGSTVKWLAHKLNLAHK